MCCQDFPYPPTFHVRQCQKLPDPPSPLHQPKSAIWKPPPLRSLTSYVNSPNFGYTPQILDFLAKIKQSEIGFSIPQRVNTIVFLELQEKNKFLRGCFNTGPIPPKSRCSAQGLWQNGPKWCHNIPRIICVVSYTSRLIGRGMILHKLSFVYWGTILDHSAEISAQSTWILAEWFIQPKFWR